MEANAIHELKFPHYNKTSLLISVTLASAQCHRFNVYILLLYKLLLNSTEYEHRSGAVVTVLPHRKWVVQSAVWSPPHACMGSLWVLRLPPVVQIHAC